MTIDTSKLKQDTYFCYFHIPDDTTITFRDYKFQYKYKKINKSSVDRVFNFDGCRARVLANRDSIDIKLVSQCGPKYFKFILWLEGYIYIVHVDAWTVTRVCKVDESGPIAGCQKVPSG